MVEQTSLPAWTQDNPIVVTARDMDALFVGCDADGNCD